MMKSMVNDNALTFKDIEKEIFSWICSIGQKVTKEILEKRDRELMESRNKAIYRSKGLRRTSVKTIYGEVSYSRTVYETYDPSGGKHYVYLLDEDLRLDNIGLISENVAELMVSSITEMSYRNCAAKISGMTGQRISAMGVWNVIQSLGKKVCNEEKELVEENCAGRLRGGKETKVLFEEADGVWLALQGKDREKRHFDKAEMKVSIAYDGWKPEGGGRYSLDGKVVSAGFHPGREFQKLREAQIAKEYSLDETEVRLMNGDGASWIKKVSDKDTHFQLDPFHRNKSIRENIPYPEAREGIHVLLEEGDISGLFEYLQIYRDSLADDEEIAKADTLIRYFKENRDGLLPYQKQGIDIPESPEGLEYRNMGTMESHVWSVIARRMKHNHTSWSIKGGNHLAKILAKKCSGKLYEVTEKLRMPVFEDTVVGEIKASVLSAAKTPAKSGNGYAYPVRGHMTGRDYPVRGDGRFVIV